MATEKDFRTILSVLKTHDAICLDLYETKNDPLPIKMCTLCKHRKYEDCIYRRQADEVLSIIPLLDSSTKIIKDCKKIIRNHLGDGANVICDDIAKHFNR